MGNGIFDTLATQPPPRGGNGVFDQIHKDNLPAAPDAGVWAGIKRNTVGAIAGLHDLFTRPASDDENTAVSVAKTNPALSGVPDSVLLAAHRLLFKPAADTGEQAANTARRAMSSVKAGHYGEALGEGADAAATGALSVVPLIGPWINSVANRGSGVDISGTQEHQPDISGAATDLAFAELAKKAPAIIKAIPAAREAIGDAIHTPEGDLTSGAKAVGKIGGGAVGAAVGSTVGHEYLGAAAGYKLGPSLLDKMFPEAESTIAAREQFEQAKTLTEAQEAAITQNSKIDAVTARNALRTQRAAENAAQDALDARDKTAQDLMDRQAAQDKLDAQATKAANAAARARRQAEQDHENAMSAIEKARQTDLASAEKLRTQYAKDLMSRQAQQDALDKAAAKATSDAQDARDQHAQDLMDRQTQQDALDRKAVVAAREAWKYRPNNLKAEPETQIQPATPGVRSAPASNGQDLISRMRKVVLPGEEPSAEDLKRAGDFTQVPLPKLQQLAKFGDKLAQNEINRRLRNQ